MPCPQGLGGPRRAQLRQGPTGRDAVVPLVVPDGHLRQLRHDGQRRAQADLRHVPDRLRAWPGARGAAAATSRSFATSSSRSATSCASWSAVKPWIIRKEEKPLSEGEYLQTPEQLDEYKQYSMCINCMLCYAACPVYGLDPHVHRAGRHRPRAALQPRFARPGGAGTRWRSSRSTRASGAAPSSASARRSVRSTSIRPAPSSATSSMRPSTGSNRSSCRGARDEWASGVHGVPPALDPDPSVHLLVAATRVLFGVHPARAEQHLRRLVRSVSAAARLRGEPGSVSLSGIPGLVGQAGSCWC